MIILYLFFKYRKKSTARECGKNFNLIKLRNLNYN